MVPFSKEEMLESEIASTKMGPFSKEEMLGTSDVKILHREIGKFWDKVLAPPGDCSACEATVADLTQRLQESQEREKKLALEDEDYKKGSTKNSLQDCDQETNEKKLLLEEAEVYKRKLLAVVLDSEKRPAKVEYRYVYVPFTATNSVAYFVTKIIHEAVKWKTKWRKTQDCKTGRK